MNYYPYVEDYKKTNRYLTWFYKNFPDDSKYSYFDLGEAVTKFKVGKLQESKIATINLNYHNTYLIDLIIGKPIEDQNKYEWVESENLVWAKVNLRDHLNLITKDYLSWLIKFRNDNVFEVWYNKLIAIKKLLADLEVSEERNKLLEAEQKCLKDWKLAIKNAPV